LRGGALSGRGAERPAIAGFAAARARRIISGHGNTLAPVMNEPVANRKQGELLASRFRLIRRLGAGTEGDRRDGRHQDGFQD